MSKNGWYWGPRLLNIELSSRVWRTFSMNASNMPVLSIWSQNEGCDHRRLSLTLRSWLISLTLRNKSFISSSNDASYSVHWLLYNRTRLRLRAYWVISLNAFIKNVILLQTSFNSNYLTPQLLNSTFYVNISLVLTNPPYTKGDSIPRPHILAISLISCRPTTLRTHLLLCNCITSSRDYSLANSLLRKLTTLLTGGTSGLSQLSSSWEGTECSYFHFW